MMLYFLADKDDRRRLATNGRIEPSTTAKTHYFESPEAASAHPYFDKLTVHAVPAIETVPGARVGTSINNAVMAKDVINKINQS